MSLVGSCGHPDVVPAKPLEQPNVPLAKMAPERSRTYPTVVSDDPVGRGSTYRDYDGTMSGRCVGNFGQRHGCSGNECAREPRLRYTFGAVQQEPNGLGAKVPVRRGWQRRVRKVRRREFSWVRCSTPFRAGGGEAADSVTVFWPSGEMEQRWIFDI